MERSDFFTQEFGDFNDLSVILLWIGWVWVITKSFIFPNRPTLISKEDLCKTDQVKSVPYFFFFSLISQILFKKERMKAKRKNHQERLTTALFYVPFVPFSAILAPMIFKTFIISMTVKGISEYLQIISFSEENKEKEKGKYERIYHFDASDRFLEFVSFCHASISLFGRYDFFVASCFFSFFSILTFHMLSIHFGYTKISSAILHRLALHVFGFVWITLSCSHIIIGLSGPNMYTYAGGMTAIMLWTSWIGDGAAYYIGNKYGYHKIFPNLSPKKSWEGTIATSVFSILLCYFFKQLQGITWLEFPPIDTVYYLFLGLIISIFDIIGDVCESFIKRLGGVKDSGEFFTGHGGILDRFDSFYFVAPVTVYYFTFL